VAGSVAIDVDRRTVTLLVIRLTGKKGAREEECLHVRERRIARQVAFSRGCRVFLIC
jgi:hypothetical protein